jgi:hypothetical protein
MASALEQKLKQLQSRVRTGPVGTFFSWWVEELRLALPDRWQEKLHHTSRNLAIDLDSGRVALYLDENHALKAIGTLPDAQDSDLLRQQLDDLLAEHELEEAPNLMLLDSGSILAREVSRWQRKPTWHRCLRSKWTGKRRSRPLPFISTGW